MLIPIILQVTSFSSIQMSFGDFTNTVCTLCASRADVMGRETFSVTQSRSWSEVCKCTINVTWSETAQISKWWEEMFFLPE